MKFLFINGVNLNLTGKRETDVYGAQSLDLINAGIKAHFKNDKCDFYQSNIEAKSALQSSWRKASTTELFLMPAPTLITAMQSATQSPQ